MGNLAALIFPVLDLNAECWASVHRRNAESAARRRGSLSPTAGSDEVQGVASQNGMFLKIVRHDTFLGLRSAAHLIHYPVPSRQSYSPS